MEGIIMTLSHKQRDNKKILAWITSDLQNTMAPIIVDLEESTLTLIATTRKGVYRVAHLTCTHHDAAHCVVPATALKPIIMDDTTPITLDNTTLTIGSHRCPLINTNEDFYAPYSNHKVDGSITMSAHDASLMLMMGIIARHSMNDHRNLLLSTVQLMCDDTTNTVDVRATDSYRMAHSTFPYEGTMNTTDMLRVSDVHALECAKRLTKVAGDTVRCDLITTEYGKRMLAVYSGHTVSFLDLMNTDTTGITDAMIHHFCDSDRYQDNVVLPLSQVTTLLSQVTTKAKNVLRFMVTSGHYSIENVDGKLLSETVSVEGDGELTICVDTTFVKEIMSLMSQSHDDMVELAVQKNKEGSRSRILRWKNSEVSIALCGIVAPA